MQTKDRKRVDAIIASLRDQHAKGTARGAGRLLRTVSEIPDQSMKSVTLAIRDYLKGEGGSVAQRVSDDAMRDAVDEIFAVVVELLNLEHLTIEEDPVPDFHEPEVTHIGRAQLLMWEEGIDLQENAFYKGIPNEIYHALQGASNSRLKRFAESPAHARYEPPFKTTPAMRMGSAIHTAILEPQEFSKRYILLPDVKDRKQGEYKDAAKHHDPDCILVGDECARVALVQSTVFADPHAGRLLQAPGWTELSGLSRCPYTRALVRFRYDKLTESGVGIDLKKSVAANERDFARSVYKYGYHIQAALYSDQYHAMTGEKLKGWVFIVVEDNPPHAVRLYVLDDDAMARGRREYLHHLEGWKKCEDSGVWPLPESKPTVLSLPRWAAKQDDETFGDLHPQQDATE